MEGTSGDFGDRGDDDAATMGGGGKDALVEDADAASGCFAASLRLLLKKSLAELMVVMEMCASEVSDRGKNVSKEEARGVKEKGASEHRKKTSEREKEKPFFFDLVSCLFRCS